MTTSLPITQPVLHFTVEHLAQLISSAVEPDGLVIQIRVPVRDIGGEAKLGTVEVRFHCERNIDRSFSIYAEPLPGFTTDQLRTFIFNSQWVWMPLVANWLLTVPASGDTSTANG